MLPPFDYFEHLQACSFKQKQREERFASLPAPYRGRLTPSQVAILYRPIEALVQDVKDKRTSPVEILHAYGKTAAFAHKKTNCVTELMLPDAEEWIKKGEINLDGPLAGIPVSLKDSIAVGGFDVSVGYSKYVNQPYAQDGSLVRLLKSAGAIPHVKTALPITLLSFESTNDVWGVCRNPHNPKYSPGGSTGGEGAILAMNGSRIGIGSDVAGSVRAPAAWSGIFSLRCSTGRWPKMGMNTSMPGQEGIPSVFSPMARTLDDLTYFTKSFISMKPWQFDYTCHPNLYWRQDAYDETMNKETLRVGVMRSDGVVPPSPAIARGLELTISALRASGHTIVEITQDKFSENHKPLDALRIASTLLCSDGGKTYKSFFRTGEWNDSGARQLYFYASRLPSLFRYIHYLWVRYVRRDPIWASLLQNFKHLSAQENWQWVAKREAFRSTWFDWLSKPEQSFDLILTPVNATPALPHNGMHDAVSSCGYTFLFNLLDYTAGVIPVTKVDKVLDKLPADFRATNGVMAGAYKYYDSEAMEGLPCAVQVVGGVPWRLQEEKTLAAMRRVVDALESNGVGYAHIKVENLMQVEEGESEKAY
ncbi:hypothetical protein LTR64_008138 [Lithohypha guttulata]|uniref:amidase n=1 Tax=Lithohypha guttulata TaxID=1690604 RepID=A0AAN7T8A0_9EURO|nr:hypothetical protein LTR51_008290 [Lithohypha guttulata]KAK5091615.1 hypothetical protein LTR05_001800 [Lithohypha guttulata]